MPLTLTANLDDPDSFYDELLVAHQDLSKEESDALNARLILLLANHIGDREILRSALRAAAARDQRESCLLESISNGTN